MELNNQQLERVLTTELERLIAAPTFSGKDVANPAAASLASIRTMAAIASQLELAGLHVTKAVDAGYHSIVATTRQTKRPRMLLNAHLDVVPVKDQALLSLRKEGDRLVGRGVYDMKFAIACYLQLVRAHRHALRNLDLGIMITSDEEIGSFHGAKLLASQGWGGDLIFIPDGGNDWQIELRAKGLWRAHLQGRGVSAHGSRPWEGKSVVDAFLPALREIAALFDNTNPMGTTCTISMIRVGEAFNQVPSHGNATFDLRSFDTDEFTRYSEQITAIAHTYGLEYTVEELGLPVHTDQHHPLVRQFAVHVETATGQPAVYTHSYGGSDARWFTEHDMQPVLLRPHGGNAHADDEWLKSADLVNFYRFLESLVLDIARTPT